MNTNKFKKKLRWLEKEKRNPNRAKIIRALAAAKLEKMKRKQ